MTGPTTAKPSLLFRQLFEKESSTYTYLLADIAHPDRPAVVSQISLQIVRLRTLRFPSLFFCGGFDGRLETEYFVCGNFDI